VFISRPSRWLGVLVVLCIALTGCAAKDKPGVATAGGAASGDPKPAPTSSQDRNDALRKFAQCERDHGIDMTDPDENGGLFVNGKVDTEKLKAANQACKSLLPDGGKPPKFTPEQVEQLRKFAACLRSYGLDVPDPDPVTGIIPIADLAKIDRNSQQFKDAEAACRDIRPSFLPGGAA
jgi:hypothetical protein